MPKNYPYWKPKRPSTILTKYHIPVGGIIVNRLLPDGEEGAFWTRRRNLERQYLAEIQQEFGPLVLAKLPLLPDDIYGREALNQVVQILEQQI